MKGLIPFFVFILISSWTSLVGQSNNTVIAHSHNDYEQERPLARALELGFQSIEIDILLHENQLKVSHNKSKLSQKPTIEELYFDPLINLIKSDNLLKWVLIDFKHYSLETLETLHSSVLKYTDLFQSRTSNDRNSPLQIILSGNIPRKEIANNPKYDYFFLDGRISDLDNTDPLIYTPIISSNITSFTTWRRNHNLKEDEMKTIKLLVNKLQVHGIKLRFWNTKDNVKIWTQLLDIGVDVISVDNLEKFKEYTERINATIPQR